MRAKDETSGSLFRGVDLEPPSGTHACASTDQTRNANTLCGREPFQIADVFGTLFVPLLVSMNSGTQGSGDDQSFLHLRQGIGRKPFVAADPTPKASRSHVRRVLTKGDLVFAMGTRREPTEEAHKADHALFARSAFEKLQDSTNNPKPASPL